MTEGRAVNRVKEKNQLTKKVAGRSLGNCTMQGVNGEKRVEDKMELVSEENLKSAMNRQW